MAIVNLGRVKPMPRGDYSPSVNYDHLDIVTYGGGSYICTAATVGNLPTNASYWQKLSDKGDTGEVTTAAMNTAIEEAIAPVDAQLAETVTNIYNADNGILYTSEITIVGKESGRYVKANGDLGTYEFASYSNAIPVSEGDVIIANLYANSLFGAIAYCDSDATDGSFVVAIAGNAYSVEEYTVVSDRDGYVCFSYLTSETHTATITKKMLRAVKKDVTALQTDISSIKPITNVTITEHETGKYIGMSGQRVTDLSGTLAYSDIIPVKRGDIIIATMQSAPAMTAISYTTEGYAFTTPAVYGASYIVQDYTLVSEHTGYIVLSYVFGSSHSCKIVGNAIAGIEHTNPLNGKLVLWCGDSIMRGNTFNDGNHGWAGRVADRYGCYFKNYGVGGSTITQNVAGGATPTISEQIETAYAEHPDADYIIFDGGCNDADLIGNATGETKPAAYGTFDANDFSGGYNTDTFCGALETICMKLSQYWLGKHVGYIVPHKMGVSNNYASGANNYRTYYETAIGICKKWCIPVLNLWDGCYMNPKHNWMCDTNNVMTNEDKYAAGFLYADRQHLTSAGYDYQGVIVGEWMKGL